MLDPTPDAVPDLRLTVIGPGPAYTRRRGRTSSCYLVRGGGSAVVLDMGHGSFAALGALLDPRTLDAIFISHLHPDHHIDLVPMRHYLKFGCSMAAKVPLHAPEGIRARYDALNDEPGFLDALPGPPLVAGRLPIGALTVEAKRVTHTDSSYAFRVALAGGGSGPRDGPGGSGPGDGPGGSGPGHGPGDDGPGLVYSGDCGRGADLLALLRPGDTLLSEAAWGANPAIEEVEHLTAADAAAVAREGGAARLILTHILDDSRPIAALRIARGVYSGPVQLAAPGMEVVVRG
jgi:ribonuclease BN (tRNA processing enzyme)